MSKVDLKKDLTHLYNPSAKEVSVVDVPTMNFLMVDGSGDPNVSLEYQQAMEALFTLLRAEIQGQGEYWRRLRCYALGRPVVDG
jgi:hypothetical protein